MAKIAVFGFTSDPDRFAGLVIKESSSTMCKRLLGLSRIGKAWTGLPVVPDLEVSNDLGDFPSLFPGYSPAVSEKALATLEPLISQFVEVFPLGSFSGQKYFVLHVVEEVDALDKEKSKYLMVDGKKASVTKFVFHEEMLKGKHIFRIPELRLRFPLVSKEFKMCVEKHGLVGARFRKKD